MADKAKKQSKLAWIAVVATIAGFALYLISGFVFSSKSPLGWQVIVASACAALLLAIVAYAGETLPKIIRDICIVGGGLALIVALAMFVLNRLEPAADVWFIPVNYPSAEKVSLYLSCVGLALYVVAYVVTTVKAFTAKD